MEIHACTQSPYMDRDDIAAILGLAPEDVRIVPTAVGGGFGSKLDLSVQPFIGARGVACSTGRSRMIYTPAGIDDVDDQAPSRARSACAPARARTAS